MLSMDEDSNNHSNSLAKTDKSFIKQFVIEYEFLKAVSGQELERVKDCSSTPLDQGTVDKIEQIQSEMRLEQEKCHQVLLRALSVALGSTATVMNAMNASM